MAKKAGAGEKKGKGKAVAMPRWSPLERQYLGINLGVLGSVVVLGGMTQNYFDAIMKLLRQLKGRQSINDAAATAYTSIQLTRR